MSVQSSGTEHTMWSCHWNQGHIFSDNTKIHLKIIMWSHKITKAVCFEKSPCRQTIASKVQLRNHWTKMRYRSASCRAPGMSTWILSSWSYSIYTETLFWSTITSHRAIFSLKSSEEGEPTFPYIYSFFLTLRMRFKEFLWIKYFSMNGLAHHASCVAGVMTGLYFVPSTGTWLSSTPQESIYLPPFSAGSDP